MFRFLREVLASTVGVLLAAVLILYLFLQALPRGDAPAFPERAVLTLDLGWAFVDNPVPLRVADWIGGGEPDSPIPLARLRDALRAAAQDPRIVGLELFGVVGPSAWTTLSEIRREIAAFRAAGKPVLADLADYDERGLYLASAADHIYLPALGELEWNGFALEVEYLARALDKFGIEMQVTRVGSYKAAVEPFLADTMSPENREQLSALLGQREQELLDAVAGGRGLDPALLRELWTTRGFLSAAEAEELGLVDGVRYWEEVAAELRGWAGEDEFEDELWYPQVSLSDYLQDPLLAPDELVEGATVAVLYAEGPIVWAGGPGEVVAPEFAQQLADLRQDEAIAAVVVRIQSPGGSATASEVILHELELLAAEKPVIVSMGAVAASGGYWIATRANEIFAEPSTVTGSIGVFGMFPKLGGLAQELGVDVEVVQSSPHANFLSPLVPMAPETLLLVQARVDRVYAQFLEHVALGRGLEPAAVEALAQGRIWTGSQAQTLGLVDRLGSLPDAVARAAALAGLKEGYAVQHLYHPVDEWEQLIASLLDDANEEFAFLPFASLREPVQRALCLIQSQRNPSRIWAQLPYSWRLR